MAGFVVGAERRGTTTVYMMSACLNQDDKDMEYLTPKLYLGLATYLAVRKRCSNSCVGITYAVGQLTRFELSFRHFTSWPATVSRAGGGTGLRPRLPPTRMRTKARSGEEEGRLQLPGPAAAAGGEAAAAGVEEAALGLRTGDTAALVRSGATATRRRTAEEELLRGQPGSGG